MARASRSGVLPPPAATSASVLDLIDRGRAGLLQACHADTAATRYELAHLAALRIAAALLAARRPPGRRSGPRDVWSQVPAVAPELGEWAQFFAESARLRQGLAAGRATVSARSSDDLVRQSEMFLEQVLGVLGLPMQTPVATCITPVTSGAGGGGTRAQKPVVER